MEEEHAHHKALQQDVMVQLLSAMASTLQSSTQFNTSNITPPVPVQERFVPHTAEFYQNLQKNGSALVHSKDEGVALFEPSSHAPSAYTNPHNAVQLEVLDHSTRNMQENEVAAVHKNIATLTMFQSDPQVLIASHSHMETASGVVSASNLVSPPVGEHFTAINQTNLSHDQLNADLLEVLQLQKHNASNDSMASGAKVSCNSQQLCGGR